MRRDGEPLERGLRWQPARTNASAAASRAASAAGQWPSSSYWTASRRCTSALRASLVEPAASSRRLVIADCAVAGEFRAPGEPVYDGQAFLLAAADGHVSRASLSSRAASR